MKFVTVSTLCLLLMVLSISCSKNSAEKSGSMKTASGDSMLKSAHGNEMADDASAENTHMGGATITVAGFSVMAPVDWTNLGASGMRQGNFTFGPIAGDADSATLGIFYFGEGQGGGVSENISRWLGQMTVPGGDAQSSAKGSEETYSGLKVHFVELEGTYNASMGGPMMGGKTIPKENYLLSGAIVEAPDGMVFFKLTGPVKTATKMNEEMKAMLAELKTVG